MFVDHWGMPVESGIYTILVITGTRTGTRYFRREMGIGSTSHAVFVVKGVRKTDLCFSGRYEREFEAKKRGVDEYWKSGVLEGIQCEATIFCPRRISRWYQRLRGREWNYEVGVGL